MFEDAFFARLVSDMINYRLFGKVVKRYRRNLISFQTAQPSSQPTALIGVGKGRVWGRDGSGK
jgi:hypothetical protein